MSGTEAVPAATTVLLRDSSQGVETLMLRRNSKLAFAGGMWVFPGGRVDPGDTDPDHPDDEQITARRAAVREAQEESGLILEPDDLVVLSRWCPPPEAPRRFNTWFFVSAAPAIHDVEIDGGEIHDHQWIRPSDAIRLRQAGEIDIIPPTWITLQQLAVHANVEDALAAVGAAEPKLFTTKLIKMADGTAVTVWDPDAAYDTGDLDLPGPRNRLVMATDAWRWEVDDVLEVTGS